MTAYVIMHNMIIENEHDLKAPSKEVGDAPILTIEMVVDEHTRF